jgi:hypothetical protein
MDANRSSLPLRELLSPIGEFAQYRANAVPAAA